MAIAWPMPELPPVTSTFLPRRPGRPAARDSMVMVSAMGTPLNGVRSAVASGGRALHRLGDRERRGVAGRRAPPEQQQTGEREDEDGQQPGADERGARRGVDEPQV